MGRLRSITVAQEIPQATPTEVWNVVVAMEQWTDFQDAFTVELLEDATVVELGTEIRITSDFGLLQPVTLERISVVEEPNRLCWDQTGIEFVGLPIPVPQFLLSTAGNRCLELTDLNGGGTMVLNTITFSGLLSPLVVIATGRLVEQGFRRFVTGLAQVFAE